jgi:hypothetical protein
MEDEFAAGEGCRIAGRVTVQQVTGVVRVTAHRGNFLLLKSTQEQLTEQVNEAVKQAEHDHKVGLPEVFLLPFFIPVYCMLL